MRSALALGLERIAITDHDCLEACRGDRLGHVAGAEQIELISGVEIDCTLDGAGIEILGYGFDPQVGALAERLAEVQADRRRRFLYYCEGLCRAGEPVDAELTTSCASLSLLKVHLFRALQQAGRTFPGGYREFSASLEALGDAPPVRTPTVAEAARLIQDAGGHVLLAHPLYYAERIGLERLVRAGQELGFVGLEFLYPYDFGAEGLPRETVQQGFARLRELVRGAFPLGAWLTRGSDVHDLAEWPARLALLEEWEARFAGPAR